MRKFTPEGWTDAQRQLGRVILDVIHERHEDITLESDEVSAIWDWGEEMLRHEFGLTEIEYQLRELWFAILDIEGV